MRAERFIIEYANYTKKGIQNSFMAEEEKAEKISKIDRAIRSRELNLITPDETIMLIGGFRRKEW